jgi:tetratricopeptide (TPR) repeat protein
MGRTYLNQSRLEEALEVYAGILRDYPDDIDSLVVLGNLYLAGGDSRTACIVYRRALELDPSSTTVRRQLDLAESEESQLRAEPVPTDPAAIRRLLQRLTGKTSAIEDEDLDKAALLLQKILQSSQPAEQVAKHLDEIDELLPALIELNIRQAEADGKPELANGLRALQENILLQVEPRVPRPDKEAPAKGSDSLAPHRFAGSVLVLLPDPAHPSPRMEQMRSALSDLGCQVTVTGSFSPHSPTRPDVTIVSNPHVNPKLLESMASLSVTGTPVLADMDADFEHMPISHPNYPTQGLGIPVRARAYTASLLLANQITVNSQMMADSLRMGGHDASYIPDGWSKQNLLWEKTSNPRRTINIGWIGHQGQLEDLMLVRRSTLRILREYTHTQMVVIGDLQAYRLFDSLPDSRRIYLPMITEEEFPYLLGQIDILLVPLRNQPFYLAASDLPLVQAGVKGIPWIASPIPAFKSWQAGGLIADNPEEWHLYLRQLVLDQATRKNLADAGQAAAKKRESAQVGHLWLEKIEQVLPSGIGRSGA